ncbi:MAG: ABC-F family ATP-binding cassette domain-containing protein [Ruminococcaceae bacterium]|nr:ABC-F family ATP-binding cassette domain-containing protein [Oscillospiraceae bacterium]
MTVLSVADLSLSFGTRKILDRISFSLAENDKMGLIGVNGCGKSTLFKAITGELEPDEGQIFVSKDKTIGILTQDSAFTVDETLGDNALEQMYGAFPELLEAERELHVLEERMQQGADLSLAKLFEEKNSRFIRDGGLEFRGRCAAILLKMGFDQESMQRPLSTLSGGQRTRLALARQLSREPDILLLDEPTNHLDIDTMLFLENFLTQYRKCVLVISHDRYFLDRVTNKTLALEYGKAKLYNGNYTASIEQRRIDKEIAEKHYQNQQKEIARQEAYIAQQRAWNRERNIIAAESRLKLLAKMERVERPKEAPKAIRLSFSKAHDSGNEVLHVKQLSMAFGQKKLFDGIGFLLQKKDRMFIVGPNGCGKSTLLKLILGKLAPTAGRVESGYNVEIGYYDQENQNLSDENTVLDELWNAYPQLTETEIRNTLALFRFIGEDVFRTVSVLSGGERARLTLAKLILSKMNLLILDEPTNHLDIDSREALESALSAFEGTILAVSHDRYFIDKLATRVFALHPGAAFEGDAVDYPITHTGRGYSEFLDFKQRREAAFTVNIPRDGAQNAAPVSDNKAQYLARKASEAEARKEKARRERLTKEAEALEKEIEELDAELFGSAATDYARAAELDSRKTAAEERLLEIYEIIGV